MDLTVGFDTQEDGVWIAPDFGDNRSKDKDQMAALLVTPMSVEEAMKVEQSQVMTTKGRQKDPAGLIERRTWIARRKVLENHVVGLRNWYQRDVKTGERKEIQSIKELISVILSGRNPDAVGMLHDVYDAIVDESRLDEMLLGKSTSPSDSH